MSVSSIRAAAAALATGVLLACGGGGVEVPFEPNRIFALGDEMSYLETDGRKYGINAFKITDSTTSPVTESATELDCTRNPIWVQAVASQFGLAFDRCPGLITGATGQILARPGQKVADLDAQLASLTGAAPNDKDLALMLVGLHDILELYGRYPTDSKATLLAEARARGEAYGNKVNALAQSGPAVVVLTVHDLGLTPFATAQNTSTGDATRSQFLTDLTDAFNNRMSVTLINDGRLIGLVYTDIETRNEHRLPSVYSLSNVTTAACDGVALPDCTTRTLVTDATSSSHMWADDLLPGANTQGRIGALAAARARNNPF